MDQRYTDLEGGMPGGLHLRSHVDGKKVADFDKPQRTRILEREVQRGVHEKVQGGYGKYQGELQSRRSKFLESD